MPWTTEETTIQFRGHNFLLRPESDELYPDVCLNYKGDMERNEAILIVRELISSIVWVERYPIKEEMITGGGQPFRCGKGKGRVINSNFRMNYLPEASTKEQRLALNLYKEAQSIDSIPYQFLGYFKILNIIHNTRRDHIDWINGVTGDIEEYGAKGRIEELKNTVPDVGDYLYKSGRCAVAHAYTDPIVDPDDPVDLGRLRDDLPVIRVLAEYIMEHELGIKSLSTINKEQTYELVGFREMLGEEFVKKVLEMEEIPRDDFPIISNIDVGIYNRDDSQRFECLEVEIVRIENGNIYTVAYDSDRLFYFTLVLSFSGGGLVFDPYNGASINDDGTLLAITKIISILEFLKDIFHNGDLAVWNNSDKTLLGRAGPFIPTNVRFEEIDLYFDKRFSVFTKEAEKREKTTRS